MNTLFAAATRYTSCVHFSLVRRRANHYSFEPEIFGFIPISTVVFNQGEAPLSGLERVLEEEDFYCGIYG